AELYRNTGQADAAAPLYERAIRLDPAQVTASVGLGAIRMERGDYAGAIRLWQDALAKNAGLLLVRTNMAAAYIRLGDRRLAEATLRQTLELNPGFPPAMELLESVVGVEEVRSEKSGARGRRR
ncbi:MAG: tetratricopeptide repeat protein, partial [Candidatus Solibacter usitatus]|nr:tetratricopeptide repeat protein [Candidatus Solibacter usitatus]